LSTRLLYRAAAVLATVFLLPSGTPSARAQSAGCETSVLQATGGKTGDRFGWSTSIDGDWAFFGAYNAGFGPDNVPTGTGSVYVFRRVDSVWTQHAELNASDAESLEDFGYSVSTSGDFLLVGARKGDKLTTEKTGAAYIYRLAGDTWIQEYKIYATDAALDDKFGNSVSLRGDWALVGAPEDDDTADDTGTIYFYHREIADSVVTWVQRARKVASDRADDDQFGTSVATTSDWAIAGAPKNDDACVPEKPSCGSGSAYIFKRTPESTTWNQVAKIVGGDTVELDLFGSSVAIDGEVAVVGAKDHPGTGARTGAVYVFRYDGSAWVQEQKLLASDGAIGDGFGYAVAISGDDIIVGAYLADPPDAAGAAYWYQYDGETWVEKAKFTASDGKAGDWFGNSVATDGKNVTVGAYKDSTSTGAAYTFTIAPGEDCNENGFPDECDIVDGLATDADGNGVPDECECTSDTQCDDTLDCTEDICNLDTSRCEHAVAEGWCVGSNPAGDVRACVPHGTQNPFDEGKCTECNAFLNQEDWSPKADGTPCPDDDNACTYDECAAGICSHLPEVEGTYCDERQEGTTCDPLDTCDGAGVCVDNKLAEGESCDDRQEGTICDPLNTCDADGACAEVFADAGTDCNDELYCNGDDDQCDGVGECIRSGDPCGDRGLICSEDNGGQCQCDPGDDKCDDGVFCNGAETCNAGTGVCKPGAVPCAGSTPLCDEDNARCVECFVDLDCDDDLYCNGEETCDVANGVCLDGDDIDCDDAVGCTNDSCNETADSCDNVAKDSNCNDGDYCNGEETCDALFDCQEGDDPCPGRLCRESDNRCVDCLAAADCDNGTFCDGVEGCDFNGNCLPSSGNPCTAQALVCNETKGACECNPSDDKCNDGLFCNGPEVCNAGTLVCDVGAAPCSGETPFCLEGNDTCVECRNAADCNDGLYCTGTEGCVNGSCTQGSNPCPGQICDEVGKKCVQCTGNADCDDGLFCNGNEACVNGTCASGTAPCAAGFVCNDTNDTCSCDDNGDCDNGVYCDGAETCVVATGKCAKGTVPCKQDEKCDEGSDRCVECLIGADCNDNDECTLDRCPDGLCRNTPIDGCKDADRDKVKDDVDLCPNTPAGANVDGNGCSCNQLDDDGDDVDNCLDQCAATPANEVADMSGCSCSQLDDDDDGVDNCNDQCPGTLTGQTVKADGCSASQSDEDGDGVPDSVDQCENTPSDEQANIVGCSSSQTPEPPPPSPIDDDEDGVVNEDDDCPNTPVDEEVDEVGCAASQLDTDGDGVSDDADTCPNTPAGDDVDENGCTIVQPPEPASCGACGAFGLVSWVLLLVGMLGLRTRFVRDSVKR